MKNKKSKSKQIRKQTPPKKSVVLANNVSPRPIARSKGKKSSKTGKMKSMRPSQGICAISNPFCPAAKGSKWPDGTMGNTMTEQFRGSFTLTTTASGDSAVHFVPAAPFGYLKLASSAAGVFTFGAAYTTYKASSILATFGDQYRIVSMGVIARSVASATNASGLLTFGTSGNAIGLNAAIASGTELYDEVTVVSLQPGKELSWIAQPRGPESRQFVSQSTSTSVPGDWTKLTIELSGCPNSTAMLNVEWFINVEFTLQVNSSVTALAIRNPPAVPTATTAVSRVHGNLGSFIEGGVKQVEDAFMQHATSALSSIMSDPLEAIAGLFI